MNSLLIGTTNCLVVALTVFYLCEIDLAMIELSWGCFILRLLNVKVTVSFSRVYPVYILLKSNCFTFCFLQDTEQWVQVVECPLPLV